MKPKDKDENAKNPDWKVPMDLPSVEPEDYDAAIDSGRGSANEDTRDGTKGFSPQLAGHSKAGHSHTTSFDINDAAYSKKDNKSGKEKEQPGQDEGQMAQPTTSAAGRLLK